METHASLSDAHIWIPESLEGKRAVVVGGTSGVGSATAKLLASAGCRVFVCGQNPDHLHDVIADSGDGGLDGIAADIGTAEGIERYFNAADQWLGGLDIAVLNAGIGAHGALSDMSHDDYRRVIDVNLASYVGCAMESIRRMKDRGGHIVMTGSMSAHVFDENAAVYTATKAGIRGFAFSLRKEVNPLRIRVSLIEPGTVGSGMVDETAEQKERMVAELRMMRSEDVARAIQYTLIQPPVCDVISMQLKPQLQFI